MVGAAPSSLPSTNIVVGGYDGSLAGLTLRPDDTSALTLTVNYAYSPHADAIRSAALSGTTLVTGSVDETIRIYDLQKRVEVGTLLHHDGTVNALEFANDGREIMFSASDDATLCVWRCSDWSCLRRLTGHQSPILDFSIHPSARVALSSSKDRNIYMWDMMKGKIVFSAKTKEAPASSVLWSPDGNRYLLAAGSTVTLSDVEGRSTNSFYSDRDVLCNAFIDDYRVAVGGEDKTVRLWDTRGRTKSTVLFDHGARVKDISVVDDMLVSADSQGNLKVWDTRMQGQPRIETQLGKGNLILTCMAAATTKKSERRGGASETEGAPSTKMEGEATGSDPGAKRKGRKESKSLDQNSAGLEGTASQRKRKKRKMQSKPVASS